MQAILFSEKCGKLFLLMNVVENKKMEMLQIKDKNCVV